MRIKKIIPFPSLCYPIFASKDGKRKEENWSRIWLTPSHRCQVTYFLPTYSRLQRLSAVDSDSSAKKPGILFKVYQRATAVLLIHSVSTFCLFERRRKLSVASNLPIKFTIHKINLFICFQISSKPLFSYTCSEYVFIFSMSDVFIKGK